MPRAIHPPDSTQDSTQNPPQQKTFRDRLDNLGKLLFGSADNRKPVAPQGDYRGDRQPPIVDSGSENQSSARAGSILVSRPDGSPSEYGHPLGDSAQAGLMADRPPNLPAQPTEPSFGSANPSGVSQGPRPLYQRLANFRQSPFGPDAQNAQSVTWGSSRCRQAQHRSRRWCVSRTLQPE